MLDLVYSTLNCDKHFWNLICFVVQLNNSWITQSVLLKVAKVID